MTQICAITLKKKANERPPTTQPLKRPPSPMEHSNPGNSTNNRSDIQLLLSRSIYSLNSSIVGSIRIPLPPSTPSSSSAKEGCIDSADYKSIQLYAAGRCRLDPRWHDVPSLTRVYGTHPHHSNLPKGVEETAVDCYFGRKAAVGSTRVRKSSVDVGEKEFGSVPCVCFWSTDAITLYDRQSGQKGDGDDDDNAIKVPVVRGIDPAKSEPLSMTGGEWFEQGNKLTRSIGSDDLSGDGNMPQVELDVVADDDDSDEQRNERIRSHALNDYEYSECSSTGEKSEDGNATIPAPNLTQTHSCELVEQDQTKT